VKQKLNQKVENIDMRPKLTTEIFISKAIQKHGSKYDYSLVDYVHSQSKVQIICQDHGIFKQTPNSHLGGHCCSICTGKGGIKLTNETFISKSIQKHGSKYDYSLVDYVNAHTKVNIICPEHGTFEQSPDSHLSGSGCPTCFGVNKITNEIFIERSIQKHGNIYDYSLVKYINIHTKVKIICPEHGVFEQSPSNHLSGSVCPSCSGFINKSIQKHGSKYDYSLVEYTKNNEKVKIICKEHGIFEQIPSYHLRGSECPSCVNKIKTETFISKAIQKHGSKYDYSLVDFKKTKTKLKIICPEHGVFEQSPKRYLGGQACPHCSGGGGFDQSKPAIFYILKVNDQDIWKIGITNRTLSKRYSKSERELFTVLSTTKFKNGVEALQLETKLKKQYKEFIYTGFNPLNGGHTEMFTVLPVFK
jgi:Zn ribbon nucleic-acid-binding protein